MCRTLALHAEQDVDHVAVLDDVCPALQALGAAALRFGVRAGLEQRLPADDLGADEAALAVGADAPRRLDGRRPGRDPPGGPGRAASPAGAPAGTDQACVSCGATV